MVAGDFLGSYYAQGDDEEQLRHDIRVNRAEQPVSTVKFKEIDNRSGSSSDIDDPEKFEKLEINAESSQIDDEDTQVMSFGTFMGKKPVSNDGLPSMVEIKLTPKANTSPSIGMNTNNKDSRSRMEKSFARLTQLNSFPFSESKEEPSGKRLSRKK